MPVLVRNTEKGPTVFSDVAKNIAIEWEGAGHPGGGDVQRAPRQGATGNVNFAEPVPTNWSIPRRGECVSRDGAEARVADGCVPRAS